MRKKKQDKTIQSTAELTFSQKVKLVVKLINRIEQLKKEIEVTNTQIKNLKVDVINYLKENN